MPNRLTASRRPSRTGPRPESSQVAAISRAPITTTATFQPHSPSAVGGTRTRSPPASTAQRRKTRPPIQRVVTSSHCSPPPASTAARASRRSRSMGPIGTTHRGWSGPAAARHRADLRSGVRRRPRAAPPAGRSVRGEQLVGRVRRRRAGRRARGEARTAARSYVRAPRAVVPDGRGERRLGGQIDEIARARAAIGAGRATSATSGKAVQQRGRRPRARGRAARRRSR